MAALTFTLVLIGGYAPGEISTNAIAKQNIPIPSIPQDLVTAQPGLIYSNAMGEASYYSYECADLPMANGKIFDPEKNTCASWFYDFGTVLVVKNLENGLSTEVVVTDRGPNKRLVRRGRIIDLSKKAFEEICGLDKGITTVIVSVKMPAKQSTD